MWQAPIYQKNAEKKFQFFFCKNEYFYSITLVLVFYLLVLVSILLVLVFVEIKPVNLGVGVEKLLNFV